MANDLCRIIVQKFLHTSWASVKTVAEALKKFNPQKRKPVTFFKFKNNQRTEITVDGNHFFLRGSVEYTNPQLTVEEVQGIIGARLLEACGNYFHLYGLHQPNDSDIAQVCELLKKPSEGKIVGFLLNTDDVEPDRYSMNPLKSSIMQSGQSAFPAGNVKTDGLSIDQNFASKYAGTLICPTEIELMKSLLESTKSGSYLDFVDSVKYSQMEQLSQAFGIDLFLPSLHMPLTPLKTENKNGLLHHIISESHSSYDSVRQAYECMGRSMTKRTTLLTIPHSSKGYGSKRAARGRIYFDKAQTRLESVNVKYKDTLLYPNAIDPQDISIAKCEDNFSIDGKKLSDYSYSQTPSTPQFFLYSLASPEDAALWHGIGVFGAAQLLKSYTSVRSVCRRGQLIRDLQEKYGANAAVPLHLNLAPEAVWVHPVHRNIDASVGCIQNLEDLARIGMKIEFLSEFR